MGEDWERFTERAGWDYDMPSERQVMDWGEHNAHADQLRESEEGSGCGDCGGTGWVSGNERGPAMHRCPACNVPEMSANAADVAEVEVYGFDHIAQARGYMLVSQEERHLIEEWREREAERKQRANFAAVADGFAPPYPDEW